MFSAALMLWLIFHKTTLGDKHRQDLCVWCCGSEKEVHPFGGARSTARRRKWRRRRRREGRGGGRERGLVSAAERVGVKFSQELK